MAKWLNRTAGVAPRNGTTSHTITFATDGDAPFTPTDGRVLLAVTDGPITQVWPGTWTERLSPVNFSELSVATRTVSGDTAVTVTHNNSNRPFIYVFYEFPLGTTWVNGASAANTAKAAAQPTVTGLPGTQVTVMFGLGERMNASTPTPSATWVDPLIEDLDLTTAFATTDGCWLSVAYEDNVVATSAATTPTISGGDLTAYERVSFAIDVPGPATSSPPRSTFRDRLPQLVR